jgi:hypothetical protein
VARWRRNVFGLVIWPIDRGVVLARLSSLALGLIGRRLGGFLLTTAVSGARAIAGCWDGLLLGGLIVRSDGDRGFRTLNRGGLRRYWSLLR